MSTNRHHDVKHGDGRTLRWDLGRDLTAVTTARVIIAAKAGEAPVVDRNGTVEDVTDGTLPARRIVALTLATADFDAGKLDADHTYQGEIETLPGPLTHPENGYFTIRVVADLG